MTSTAVDVLAGANSSLAVKAPCQACSSVNIAVMNGLLVVDGYQTVTGDRILVNGQADQTQNGIWNANTSGWTRAPDADGNSDWAQGSMVKVNAGAANSGFWYLSSANPVVVGTSNITFIQMTAVFAAFSVFMQTLITAPDATTAFGLIAAGGLKITGELSGAGVQLAANTNDWAPAGFAAASTILMGATAAWNLTGIAGGAKGRLLCLHNTSAFTVTLKNSATSVAANQFLLSADYALAANQSVALEYDDVASRWRIFGQQGASGTATTANRLVSNVGITVTMAANAATIALKQADGASDATAGSPCIFGFRHPTLTTGQVLTRNVTAAQSGVIASGATLGTVNGVAARIWIAMVDATSLGGGAELAWMQGVNGANYTPIDENALVTTVAAGGASNAAGTWYSTTGRAGVPLTVIGYFEATEAAAGTWATNESLIAVNPQIRPGTVLQSVRTDVSAMATGTTAVPIDNTIPQSTEGDQYMSQAITPRSAANFLDVSALGCFDNSNASAAFVVTLMQDAGANALKASPFWGTTAGGFLMIPLRYRALAAGVAATTFKVRAGGATGATTTFNGAGGAAYFGATINSFLQIDEVAT